MSAKPGPPHITSLMVVVVAMNFVMNSLSSQDAVAAAYQLGVDKVAATEFAAFQAEQNMLTTWDKICLGLSVSCLVLAYIKLLDFHLHIEHRRKIIGSIPVDSLVADDTECSSETTLTGSHNA